MSKFGAIIKEAKNQNAGKPENQKEIKPENRNARKQQNQTAGKPAGKSGAKVNDRDVNLSIKVSESRRRHWAAEAKRRGTSLTAVIVESLSKEFGEPE